MDLLEWQWLCLDLNLTKFDPKGSVVNMSALVQVMAWFQTGNEPLSEPILTHFTDV